MQRILFGCAAFLSLASPLYAQQAPPNQSVPEQPVPPESPPASSQPLADLPPFIPPPRARLYDNYRPASHHRAHRRTMHPSRRAHHISARRHHSTHPAVHLSRRTIRQCHAMTYRQIMRHGTCRELMKRELRAPARGHHHASHRRGSAHDRRAAHRHRR